MDKPKIFEKSVMVEDLKINCFTVVFENGVFLSIFGEKAKLGSLVLAVPMTIGGETQSIVISGREDLLPRAFSEKVAHVLNKFVLLSLSADVDAEVNKKEIFELLNSVTVEVKKET